MYLSKLTLNPRSKWVRQDLRDPYQMHRTVMRGFPDAEDGGPGRVLFRVDLPRDAGLPVVLVQSEGEPDWTPLEEGEYLTTLAECKPFSPQLAAGQELRFRLRANPTVKRDGKRKAVNGRDQRLAWLKRKAQGGGFELGWTVDVDEGLLRGRTGASPHDHELQFASVRFEGVLRVVDPQRMAATLQAGVGSGKGLGFGLLSIAPVG
jgi:CRISPR system Cascade subunit CasE